MTILKIKPLLIKFENTGELGAFIGANQFSYQLAPHHPHHGIIFVVYCDCSIKGNKEGELNFKARVEFYFDTETHKPTLNELHHLTEIATVEMNKLLEKEILEKTEFEPFEIYDSDPENSLKILEQNLIAAYPEN